jgi:hypothetical protein
MESYIYLNRKQSTKGQKLCFNYVHMLSAYLLGFNIHLVYTQVRCYRTNFTGPEMLFFSFSTSFNFNPTEKIFWIQVQTSLKSRFYITDVFKIKLCVKMRANHLDPWNCSLVWFWQIWSPIRSATINAASNGLITDLSFLHFMLQTYRMESFSGPVNADWGAGHYKLWRREFSLHHQRLERFELVVEVEVNLRPTVSRPVCLGFGLPSGADDQTFFFCLTIAGFLMCGTLSDERMGL